ncbi:cation:proton antiporter [Streptomyces sp. NPDC004327]|uniref:cation:proton antiporter n=1 Tax=unclassified Streptomyces TaxID=2593676 RepID=UPI0036763AF9
MSLATVTMPGLPGPQLMVFLLQVSVLLTLALLLGRLAGRFGMPVVVGELLVGVLVGPSVLGSAFPDLARSFIPGGPEQAALLDGVGQLGVILLVGMTGGHLDMAMIKRHTKSVTITAVAGLVLPFGLGVAAGYLAPESLMPDSLATHGGRTVFALMIGVALAVSALPVIAKTLADMKLLHRNTSQLTLAAGMVDDAAAWFALSAIVAMGTGGSMAAALGNSALSLVLFTGGVALAVKLLIAPLLKRLPARDAGAGGTTGRNCAILVILLLLGAAAAVSLHLEAVFGAFVVGLATISLLPAASLAPLRTIVMSVFAPLYFATAGLRIDLTALARPTVLLAGLAVLAIAIVGKLGGAYLGARLSGVPRWDAFAIGAGLNARGVVQIIVANVGLRSGILSPAVYTLLVLVAVVTSIMAAPMLRAAMRRTVPTELELGRERELAAWHIEDTPPLRERAEPLAAGRAAE